MATIIPRLLGMLHAPPLPGSPGYRGNFEAVKTAVLRDAEAIVEGGIGGLVLENFGDAPFYPRRVPAEAVAAMSVLGLEIRRRFAGVALGINVLRNDGPSALAVALACGATMIRVNVLCGARVTDQGLIEGVAHELLRDRARLHAGRVKIFADVDVKHSAPLAVRPIEEEAEETVHRGGADALIVTGRATGSAADPEQARRIKAAVPDTPVWIGSGVTPESLAILGACADGFIVGTWLKRDGKTTNPVDPARVRSLVASLPP